MRLPNRGIVPRSCPVRARRRARVVPASVPGVVPGVVPGYGRNSRYPVTRQLWRARKAGARDGG